MAPGRARRPYTVRSSPTHGRGAFATRTIRKGARIVEYRGARSSWDVACERPPSDPSDPYHTLLFELADGSVIDAGVRGNAARWINHGCAPNCQAVGEGDKVFIEAIKAIKPGQELVYDYGFVFEERHTPELKARYKCLCGAKTCRGTMLAKKR